MKVKKQMVKLTIFDSLRTAFDELTEMLKNGKDLEGKDEYVKAIAALNEAKLQLA